MNQEELAEKVLKMLLDKGADDVVVTADTKDAQQIKFSNSKINATKTWELINLNLFIAINKRLVTTSIRDPTLSSAENAVKRLISFAKSAQPNDGYGGIAEGPFNYKEVEDSYDPKIVQDDELGIKIVEAAINQASDLGAKRCAGVFESYVDNVYLVTSQGVKAKDRGTNVYFSIRGFADKHASGHMVSASRTLKDFHVNKAVEKAVSIAKKALNPVSISPGKYDVVFDYLPYANLLGNLGEASSIFSVEAGLSCLADKLGKQVANPNISFYDNGCLKNGFNSSKFDGEGVPTRETQIIENGILKNYLHSTSTAKRYNTTTTANAGIVSPEPFNLVLKPGTMTNEELIESVKKGIYITNVWYTRFQNYNTGDFSTIPRDGAFLIENGKITKSLKDLRVSDNLLKVMQSTEALGNKSEQLFGWEVETPVITPIALIKNLNITKSE